MKVRVLYPTMVRPHVDKDVEGGQVITMDADLARALIEAGGVEPENAKPDVEQATAGPGEKRASKPRKSRG